MSILYVLILISGLIATGFLVFFIWSVRSGQYDDTYSPSVRMLFNDEVLKKKDEKKSNSKQSEEKEVPRKST